MSGIIDHWAKNDCTYGHGIIFKNCFARKYSEGCSAVQHVDVGTFVEVHSIREDDVIFCIVHDDMQVDTSQWLCKKADIIHVPENLWGPLFTLQKFARLPLLEDRKTAESIGNISVGDTVQVLGPDNTSICIANVTFRNSIGRLGVGVYFGLQILSPNENLQAIIQKVSLLEPGTKGFPRNCDVVVTVDKIRPCNFNHAKEKSIYYYDKETEKDLMKNHRSGDDFNNTNYKSVIVLNLKDKFSNSLKKSHHSLDFNINYSSTATKITNSDNPLAVGEEVVYLDGDTPEKGVVRWIGHIKNSLKVCVEFDNPIKSDMGMVDGVELLKNKNRHAVMPPMALIKLSDYMMNNTKEKLQYKNNNNNINNSSGNNNIKNNNNNNNNNNYNSNYVRPIDFCCDGKLNAEEKYKMVKTTSNPHQCLRHPERTFHCDDSFQGAKNEEAFLGKHSCADDAHKSDHGYDLQMHHNSKSFDGAKPSEKKLSYRRHFVSLDNDPLHNKEPKVQGTGAPTQRPGGAPCQDFYDLVGQNWSKQERTPYNTSDRKPHKNSEDVFLSYKSSLYHSNEGDAKDYKEKDAWDLHHSEHSSSEENLGHYYDTPKPTVSPGYAPEELGKGSVVELTFKGEPHYGVIRWIGTLQDDKEVYPPRLVAGIEMEEEMDGFTDGTINSRRYFQCNPRKALFIPLSKCRKDSRFADDTHRLSVSSKINYGQIDCPVVEGTVPPINRKGDIESICGKNRGIQGHHNSCYLDATLFSMFAFTSVFDSLLYRPPTKHDLPQYGEVQRVLREEIVNPLRKNLYVRADRVMKLRTLLEKLSSVSGLTSEEKDPEEFLNSLLAQILKAEPFLKLSSGQEAFHYQLFVEKDERLVFPSVQQLFEQSFVTSDIKLKQIPSCLIIQMPRFGKSFKMYSRILPPQLLDVTDIIENSPRQCTVCGKLAEYECKDCFGQQGIGNGLESISFCKTCLETAHNHHCRTRHNYRSLTVPVEFFELQEHCIIPRLYLELFAVVCIETSHYVAFVKCGSGSDAPWCFFDSMADRKGEQNGYNIPEMVPCPDLPYWLSEDGAKMLNEMSDDRQLPEHAKRLFSDAYMCMYQSPDLMMYR